MKLSNEALFPNNKKMIIWLFAFLFISILCYVQYIALLEIYEIGAFSRPYVWIGIITWGFFGFNYYNINKYFANHKKIGFSFVVFLFIYFNYVKVMNYGILYELAIPIGFSPIIAILRVLLFEKRINK